MGQWILSCLRLSQYSRHSIAKTITQAAHTPHKAVYFNPMSYASVSGNLSPGYVLGLPCLNLHVYFLLGKDKQKFYLLALYLNVRNRT